MEKLTLLDNFKIHNFLNCLEKDEYYRDLFRVNNEYPNNELIVSEIKKIINDLVFKDCIVEKISAFYNNEYHLFLKVASNKDLVGMVDYFYIFNYNSTIQLLAVDHEDNIHKIYDSNIDDDMKLYEINSVLTYKQNEDESEIKDLLERLISFNKVLNMVHYFREISFNDYIFKLKYFSDNDDYISHLNPIRKRFMFKTLENEKTTLFYDFISDKVKPMNFVDGIEKRFDLLTYKIKNFNDPNDEKYFMLFKNNKGFLINENILDNKLYKESKNIKKLPKEMKQKQKELKKEKKEAIKKFKLLDPGDEEDIAAWVSGVMIPWYYKLVRFSISLSKGSWGVIASLTTGEGLLAGLSTGFIIFTIHSLFYKVVGHVGYKYMVRYFLKVSDKLLWDPLYEEFKDDDGIIAKAIVKTKKNVNGLYKGILQKYDMDDKEMINESVIDNIVQDYLNKKYINKNDLISESEIEDILLTEKLYAEGPSFRAALRNIKRTTSKLPKKIFKKLNRYKSKVEHIIANHRQVKREKLKEKLINDEVIPFLDEILEWFVGLVSAYGVYAVLTINPIVALIAGLITGVVLKTSMKERTKKRKEVAIQILKDEIDMLEENIQDARNENDRKARDTMKRMQKKLERQLQRIRVENRLT